MPIENLTLTNCTGTINIREAKQEDDRVLNNAHDQYSDLTLHGNQNLTISCSNELKNIFVKENSGRVASLTINIQSTPTPSLTVDVNDSYIALTDPFNIVTSISSAESSTVNIQGNNNIRKTPVKITLMTNSVVECDTKYFTSHPENSIAAVNDPVNAVHTAAMAMFDTHDNSNSYNIQLSLTDPVFATAIDKTTNEIAEITKFSENIQWISDIIMKYRGGYDVCLTARNWRKALYETEREKLSKSEEMRNLLDGNKDLIGSITEYSCFSPEQHTQTGQLLGDTWQEEQNQG